VSGDRVARRSADWRGVVVGLSLELFLHRPSWI
jgi:hypothetical protein